MVQGLGVRGLGVGCMVYGVWFRVLGCSVYGLELGV